jgi:hypothetical protein
MAKGPLNENVFKVDRELEIQVTQSFEDPYTVALMKKKADGERDQNLSGVKEGAGFEKDKFLHMEMFTNAKIMKESISGSQKETFIETVSTSKN